MSQSNVVCPRKSPIKRHVKEDIKVSDTKDENLFFFTDRLLKIAFDIKIDNHHDKHANSIISFTSNFNKIGVDIFHNNKIKIEMSKIFAKLMNQNIFKNQSTFFVIFNKYGENNDKISEKELPNISNITHILTQSELGIIYIQWTLDNRIQSKEMKKSGWNFQRNNSMKISFYKSGELNGSSDVKIPLGPSAFLNVKYDDKYCFFWSISAKLHPCEINFNRATNYRQCFNE